MSWCFPIAGCVSYRGYFSEARAQRFAERLRRRGDDVSVEGVSAYSTLGWFDDPILSTWIGWPEDRVAALLFHELAHLRLYRKGDTTFNESFATLVERVGLRRWLAQRQRRDLLAEAEQRERRDEDFVDLVLGARERLGDLYASEIDDDTKRRRKGEIFARLQADYRQLRDRRWGGWSGYDSWFDRQLNNAHLAGVGEYNALVPALERRLEALGGDLESFYSDLEASRRASPEELRRRLGVAVATSEEDSR